MLHARGIFPRTLNVQYPEVFTIKLKCYQPFGKAVQASDVAGNYNPLWWVYKTNTLNINVDTAGGSYSSSVTTDQVAAANPPLMSAGFRTDYYPPRIPMVYGEELISAGPNYKKYLVRSMNFKFRFTKTSTGPVVFLYRFLNQEEYELGPTQWGLPNDTTHAYAAAGDWRHVYFRRHKDTDTHPTKTIYVNTTPWKSHPDQEVDELSGEISAGDAADPTIKTYIIFGLFAVKDTTDTDGAYLSIDNTNLSGVFDYFRVFITATLYDRPPLQGDETI